MEVLRNLRGTELMVFEGYTYTRHLRTDKKIRWRCVKRHRDSCRGAIYTTLELTEPILKVDHNHVSNDEDVAARKEIMNLTSQSVISLKPPSVIYNNNNNLSNKVMGFQPSRGKITISSIGKSEEKAPIKEKPEVLVTKQNYLQDSSPSRKFVKVTLTSTQNETQTQPSRTGQPNIQSMRTGQPSVQPTSQAYVHQSLSNPVAMKRLKITTPICNIDQRSRPQQTLISTRQPVKPPTNQETNVIQIHNSLQQSIRTQEQQHQMKVRNLRNSVSNHSQIILSDTSQLKQGKQNFIPRSSDYVRQNNQTTTCSTGVSSNFLTAEKCISDDSALPMDYAKFFEEASKLPKMGCDVFVLVSYPGCKPAYWGTEKYVRKFENSERLLPFSESGCLSIKLRGTTDKQNLLANNLDLLSDNPNSLASNMGTEIFIKDEPMESANNMPVAHDDVKQEYPNGGDQTPPTRNRRTRIKVTAQKPDNSSLEARNTGSQNTNSLGGKQQYTKQLNTNTHYGSSNTYGFSTKNTNWNGSRQSLRENDDTNYYDTGESIIKIEPGMDVEHLSMDESTLQLESAIAEPSIVLIKTEPQTADYREVDRLVYTEYG